MTPDAATWDAWDAALRFGRRPHDELPFLSDEDIIGLLATGVPAERHDELRLLATELTSRLDRFRRLVDAVDEETREKVAEAAQAAERADRRTHETAQSIEHHIEVRQDQVEDEPRSARAAHAAARETRDAVDALQSTEGKLAAARQEIGRHAREPPE